MDDYKAHSNYNQDQYSVTLYYGNEAKFCSNLVYDNIFLISQKNLIFETSKKVVEKFYHSCLDVHQSN